MPFLDILPPQRSLLAPNGLAISLDHARLYADLNRLNAELRRSEADLAEGEKISHTASWAWNVTTGEAYWSQEHLRIFGFEPEKAMPSYRMFL